jgi:spore germination protein GerM
MRKKRSINATQWTFLGLSALVLLVLVIVFFRGGGRELVVPASQSRPSAEQSSAAEAPRASKSVTLFFLSEEDSLLHPETREITAGDSPVGEATATVQELIRGSQKGYLSPFPPETELRQLFITKDGIAYVDFSKEFMDKHPSGSSAELATVYSIVNTLAYNFKPVKKVFILVEGGEKETLGGHINLGQAFLPLYSLDAQ